MTTMTPHSLFFSESTIITGFIVCCLIVLAVIMLPRAIRHSRRVKQNGKEQGATEDGRQAAYKSTFLTTPKTAKGKPVFIGNDTRQMLERIARRTGEGKLNASGFADNILRHHLEEFEQVINNLPQL